ncbi:hypothetical protein RF11_07104 [Thelohanellus kitauei]|uniref:CCHC-type domain-containing protein n=1 Tax=Thelohanellus kitauei TaxID=669202 RepID=A0A0C2MN06_THEKT|nr:hypothetical protein RF11_07104 [Thelohanellus kitauei]
MAHWIAEELPTIAIDGHVREKLLAALPPEIGEYFILSEELSSETIVKNAQSLIDKQREKRFVAVQSKEAEYEERILTLETEIETLKIQHNKVNGPRKARCQTCRCNSHTSQECDRRVVCRVCGIRGHVMRICQRDQRTEIGNYRVVSSCSDQGQLTSTVWDEVGVEFNALVDTGSSRSLRGYC